MTLTADAAPTRHARHPAGGASPAAALPIAPLLAFWATFAIVVVAAGILNPVLFLRQDPDSLMRIVEVRDLLAGQAWFDLHQHRLDPPGGALMHWSRLIDAPIAGLIRLGDHFGAGERFALTAWPLVLLLVLMVGVRAAASRLAGRDASLPALVLTLLFFSPVLMFTPGNIDHHSAQIALTIAVFASVLALEERSGLGLLAGCLASVILAIGLEMMPALAVLTGAVALRWAMTGRAGRGTALYGAALAGAPTALYVATGSPEASMACDSLSWVYAVPAAVGGAGLFVLASLPRLDRAGRLIGLAALSAAILAIFIVASPQCLGGPYGFLAPELKRLFLDTVSEAEPLPVSFIDDPVGMIAVVAPPCLALLVALLAAARGRAGWALAAALVATPLALSFYQVRTLPLANAVSIAVLGAWLAEVSARRGPISISRGRASLPLAGAFLATLPFTYLGLGAAVDEGLFAATGARLAAARPANSAVTPGLTESQTICTDRASARLLASAPTDLVMSPVFYGSTVLAISSHSVVAAPYHRAQQAILDAIHTMSDPPNEALAILRSRRVAYLAICSSDRAAARIVRQSPHGLLARLLAGDSISGLQPILAIEPTQLRFWRVGPA